MRDFQMELTGERATAFSFINLGVEMGEYVKRNTKVAIVLSGKGICGEGPESRLIEITYDLNATQEKNVHKIKINDPVEGEEERLERELKDLYKKFDFSIV